MLDRKVAIEAAAKQIMIARGHKRFLTASGLHTLPIWLLATRDAEAAITAVEQLLREACEREITTQETKKATHDRD